MNRAAKLPPLCDTVPKTKDMYRHLSFKQAHEIERSI